jgi:hypothetical protein
MWAMFRAIKAAALFTFMMLMAMSFIFGNRRSGRNEIIE